MEPTPSHLLMTRTNVSSLNITEDVNKESATSTNKKLQRFLAKTLNLQSKIFTMQLKEVIIQSENFASK
jgi:hypothetical protein